MVSIAHQELVPKPSLTRDEMRDLQDRIAARAIFETNTEIDLTDFSSLTIAGIDQSFINDTALSAIVVMQDTEIIEQVYETTKLSIPYIPGLLSFREGPPIIQALKKLRVEPDILMFDGNGRLHFREAGIATHIGVLVDVPSVGVAKSLLCGRPGSSLENRNPGEQIPIYSTTDVETEAATILGYAVQTKQYDSETRTINPVYVSSGHRISGIDAAEFVLNQCAGYKLPEPIRLADQYANSAKKDVSGKQGTEYSP